MDRCYRIGQTKNVFVYKIIGDCGIEKRVLEVQKEKETLIRNVIKSEGERQEMQQESNSQLSESSQNDMTQLFSNCLSVNQNDDHASEDEEDDNEGRYDDQNDFYWRWKRLVVTPLTGLQTFEESEKFFEKNIFEEKKFFCKKNIPITWLCYVTDNFIFSDANIIALGLK